MPLLTPSGKQFSMHKLVAMSTMLSPTHTVPVTSSDSSSHQLYLCLAIQEHLRRVYDVVRAHEPLLSRNRFEDWLLDTQHQAIDVLPKDKYGFEEFLEVLYYNRVLEARKEVIPEQKDITKPLSNYYISSSHNTYLSGNQLSSSSSTEAYKNVLIRGCRFIEIDVFDGEDIQQKFGRNDADSGFFSYSDKRGRPKSTHTMETGRSERPASIWSFIRKLRGNDTDSGFFSSSDESDRPKSTFTLDSRNSVDAASGWSVMKGEPLVLPALVGFRAVCKTIRESAFLTSNFPLIVSLEVHASLEQQELMVEIMKEEWNGLLVDEALEACTLDERIPMLGELLNKILIKIRIDTDNRHPTIAAKPLLPTPPANEYSRLEGERSGVTRKAKICENLRKLGIYTQAVLFKGFDAPSAKSPAHIFSIGESSLLELIERRRTELFAHNRDFFMRACLSGHRFLDPNPNPSIFWGQGIQIVDLNWQQLDAGMMLNEGMFAGENGWVLKPPGYRSDNTESIQYKSLDLKITVYAGQHIPLPTQANEKNFRPYIRCQLHVEQEEPKSAERGGDGKHAGYKQRTPYQKGDQLDFGKGGCVLAFPSILKMVEELSFVRIEIKDSQGTLAAWACIRLDRLQSGYRFLRLLDANGLATAGLLLIKVEKLYKAESDDSNAVIDVRPDTLQSLISKGDVSLVENLLETCFDSVAEGRFEWIRELKEMGYPDSEIAELLVTSEKDSPWIYFDPKSNDTLSMISGFHQPGCVHRSRIESNRSQAPDDLIPSISKAQDSRLSTSTDEEGSSLFAIEELCGLAGVSPNTRYQWEWMGSVMFLDTPNGMTAAVTYRFLPKPADSWKTGDIVVDPKSQMFINIKLVAKQFSSAVRQAQDNGMCCSSFTILRKSSTKSADPETSIELSSLDLKAVVELFDMFQYINVGADRDLEHEGHSPLVSDITNLAESLCEEILGFRNPPCLDNGFDKMLYSCALLLQLLTLGFTSYIRAHVGGFQPFFLDTPLTNIQLYGSQDFAGHKPSVSVSLLRFTCLDEMIQKPVMVFSSLATDDEIPILPGYDLWTTSEYFLDTWGPGQFIPGEYSIKSLSIRGILIGGGIVMPAEGSLSGKYHWNRDILPHTQSNLSWSPCSKIRIAGGVQVNLNCKMDMKDNWQTLSESLENLGTYSGYWDMTELQAGLAISGSQFVGAQLQCNKTWTWHDGNSWKQCFLGRLSQELPFEELDRPWGLQVSFCTGVARRIPLRELLADVMPDFVEAISIPAEWEVLSTHGIIDAFKGDHLKEWLSTLDKLPNSLNLISLVKRIVHYILLGLRDTGIDRTGKKFRIAVTRDQVSGKPLVMCLEIPCEKASLWARILADSKNCATFASMTSLCLESGDHKCHTTNPWHCPSLQTAVCRYRPKPEALTPQQQGSVWQLKDQALYWIGKPESGLQTRVRMDPYNKEARLYVSVSAMSEKTLKRLGSMRLMSKLGKRTEHLREKQYSHWAGQGVVVLAEL